MNTAIILAGGFGTRLKSVISDIPKPMAPVNRKPFLHYVLLHLKANNCEKVILSVGYKHEVIEAFFGNRYLEMEIVYSIEDTPLGTGGAIKKALTLCKSSYCHILNGDTLFEANLDWNPPTDGKIKMYVSQQEDISRYGALQLENNCVVDFKEKGAKGIGHINAGIYHLPTNLLLSQKEEQFSFETEILSTLAPQNKIIANIQNAYFIDIGIPEDYLDFQEYMNTPLNQLSIDSTWTLFLDRDGVINERLIDDYVKQLNELAIIEGVPEAIAHFNTIFKRIVVVTNQQGIGKGMMDENDLEIIHGYMNNVFKDAGGEITKFYFAPQVVKENSNYRKPGTGMGLHAQEDYPDINFSKCLMIGDSESDIEFGMKLGMKTIMLTTVSNVSTKADYIFKNLYQVSQALK